MRMAPVLRSEAMAKLSSFLRRVWLNLILGAVLALLVFSCIAAPLGPRDLILLRHHRVQLETQRSRLIADNAELTARTQRLQSDDAYLQRLIRRELGYARADELVYRFPRPDLASEQ
jgi:cell division protein FtsB